MPALYEHKTCSHSKCGTPILADAHLGPRIVRMLVHPVLGTVAVQLARSTLLEATPALQAQLQCELTVQELALAR